jgi:hypothetical protein
MTGYGEFGPTLEGPTPKGWDCMTRLIEELQERFGICRTSLWERGASLRRRVARGGLRKFQKLKFRNLRNLRRSP